MSEISPQGDICDSGETGSCEISKFCHSDVFHIAYIKVLENLFTLC